MAVEEIMRLRVFILLVGLIILPACSVFPGEDGGSPPDPTLSVSPTTASTDLPTPTFTITWLPSPTATNTPLPTATPAPTRLPTPTQTPAMPYQVQLGSPRMIRAFSHADQGCSWFGIGGQVIDESGTGIPDLGLLLTGRLDGQEIELASLTQAESFYGPGGFEIYLSNTAPTGSQDLAFQLFNMESQPLSDRVPVSFSAQCDQNLVLVNFRAGSPLRKLFLPLVFKNE
jgi:hypothetical protein